jgi:hypothetical protein
MSDLAAVDNRSGQKRGRPYRGFGVSVNLTHAKVAREKPPAKPAPIAPAPVITQAATLTSIEITGRALARIENYDALWNAVRARVDALGITRMGIGVLSQLADGYCGKLLGAARVRKISLNSLERILEGTGCYLVLVEDPAATETILAAAEELNLFRRGPPRQLKLLPPPRPPAS